MDITEWFPILVCQNIFNHLPAQDLLEATLVNKEWNEIIGKTKGCMRKVRLVFKWEKSEQLTPEIRNILRNSDRKYENLGLTGVEMDDFFKDIIEKVPWKTLTTSRVKFPTKSSLMNMLERIEPLIEELIINEPTVLSNQNHDKFLVALVRTLKFPRLRILHSNSCDREVFSMAFVNCANLEVFHFKKHWNLVDDASELIKPILRNNRQLKDLKIESSGLELIFDDDIWKRVEFKLTKLILNRYVNRHQDELHDLTRFLEVQSSSLETLSMCAGITERCMQVVYSMPKLKYLKFPLFDGTAWNLNWPQLDLPISQSIEKLRICDMNGRQAIMEALVRSLPNLKCLTVTELTDDAVIFLSATVPRLEVLFTALIDLKIRPDADVFPVLKKFHADAIKTSFELSTEAGNFERLLAKAQQLLRTCQCSHR